MGDSCGWRRLLLALVVMLPTVAISKQRPVGPAEQVLPLERDVVSPALRLGVDSGAPLAIYEVFDRVQPGTPEAMAREFLARNAGALRLGQSSLADLEFLGTHSGPAGNNVHFIQRVAGVPVHGARIVVHVSPAAVVTQVASGYRPFAALATTVPSIDAATARSLALQRLQAELPLRFDRVELMALDTATATHLAWQVRFVPRAPIGDWEVLVDALTAEVLSLRDRSQYAEPVGNIFNPDPLSSSRSPYGSPIADIGDADDIALELQLDEITLGALEQTSGGLYQLKTQWAELADFEPPNLGLFRQESPDYRFTRSQDGFEAVNTFWHIQESMRYINETLGLNVRPFQYEGGVQFDPHGVNGDDNSHYTPSNGQVAFGEGCVDDAEDADVIRHELAHGLHDWVTLGGGANEIDGLGEGTGDYWAQSYSRSLNQWLPEDEAYQWVFNWDGHNECWAGRITGYPQPWPLGMNAPVVGIHSSGQMWATCLMRIYDRIGREQTDRALLEGLAMTAAYSTQNDAANGFHQAAVDMGYPDAEQAAIEETFADCGYLIGVAVPALPLPPLLTADQRSTPTAGLRESATPVRFGGAISLWLLVVMVAMRRRGPARS